MTPATPQARKPSGSDASRRIERELNDLVLKLDPEERALVESLQQHFKTSSRREVVRKALSFLDLLRKTERSGGAIAVEDADGRISRLHVL